MIDGVSGRDVDWSELDGQRVWLRLLPNGDMALIIDGGYGAGSSRTAKREAEEWARDLGVPLELLIEHPCECGIAFGSEYKLAEHRYTSHDGPEPAHWLAAEERAA